MRSSQTRSPAAQSELSELLIFTTFFVCLFIFTNLYTTSVMLLLPLTFIVFFCIVYIFQYFLVRDVIFQSFRFKISYHVLLTVTRD